jgi:integrase
MGNQDKLSTVNVKAYLEGWMAKKELEIGESSLPEYRKAVDELLDFLGPKANRHVDAITVEDAVAFRNVLVVQVSAGTVNKKLKILRGAWNQARLDGLTTEAIFTRVQLVKKKAGEATERRAFTRDELRAILGACTTEWRGVVLAGVYLGQRLGDIISLTWGQIDLGKKEIRLTTRKTGRRMLFPMASPLFDYFMSLPAPEEPATPIFPTLHSRAINTLSNDFRGIMAKVGLSKPVEHPEGRTKEEREKDAKKTKAKGRRRSVNELSFHALRHTATTLLKSVGTSDVVARELIGHESEAVSRAYTHLPFETLREAVDKLPDITSK